MKLTLYRRHEETEQDFYERIDKKVYELAIESVISNEYEATIYYFEFSP